MRITLTIDEDVAAILKRLRRSRDMSLKGLVNEALRRGLRDMRPPKRHSRRWTRSVNLGPLQIASIDNIAEVLAIAGDEPE